MLQVRAAAALSNIKQVDEEELEVIVGSTIEKPTVIDFYATWCGPCLLLAQELEKVRAAGRARGAGLFNAAAKQLHANWVCQAERSGCAHCYTCACCLRTHCADEGS
jgi:thioredoxin-like negative regulator of GroEL